jgi:hypothetical protein
VPALPRHRRPAELVVTGAARLRPIIERRTCDVCRRRRRTFLVVETLTFTTAWFCVECADRGGLTVADRVHLVFIEES